MRSEGFHRRQFLSGLAATASAFASSPTFANDATETLRAADTHPAGYPTVESVKYMGRLLTDRSAGRIRLKMYPGRQLGEERDTIEQTVFGAIDINRVFLPALTSVIPETKVFALPFIFRDPNHRDRVLNGSVGEKVFDAMRPFGLVGLAYFDSGIRSIYTRNTPIRHPDDLRGVRIRVANSNVSIAALEALGANATPMEFGQVYEALRSGAVDGAENNWPAYIDTRHYEVAPTLSLTEHSMTPDVLTMSKRRWEKLSDDDQSLIRQAARDAARHMSKLWGDRVAQAHAEFQKSGGTIIDVKDKQPFIDAVAPVYARFAGDPVLTSLIREIRETP